MEYILEVYPILKDRKIVDGVEYRKLSNSFIQERINYSVNTIRDYLEKLEANNLITIYKAPNNLKGIRYIHLNITCINDSNNTSNNFSNIKNDNKRNKETEELKETEEIYAENFESEGADFREEAINSNKNKAPAPKHHYGDYGHVMLDDKQLEALQSEFPSNWQEWITRVDNYCESSGKSYKNYLQTIRNWSAKDNNKTEKYKPKVSCEHYDGTEKLSSKVYK